MPPAENSNLSSDASRARGRKSRPLLEALARCYFSYFPVERGKWRIWTHLRRRLSEEGTPRIVEKRLPHGVRMKLNTADEVDRFIYFWNQWEPNETWLVRRLLKPGDGFVDVGANIGYFTLLAAKLVGPTGHVMAIEASPATVMRLRANVALNKLSHVSIQPYAATDANGEVQISQRYAANSGMNSLRAGRAGGDSWTVPARRIDLLVSQGWRPALVKIDIEGAEALALRGMSGLLAAPDGPDVLCEVTPEFIAAVSGDPAEPFRIMAGHGYRAYRLEGRSLVPFTAPAAAAKLHANLFFSRRPETAIP